jgi:transposase
MLDHVTLAPEAIGARIAQLEARLAEVLRERDLLRVSYERLRLELEMLKRRIFVAKAERVDTAHLEREFAEKLAEVNRLANTPKPSGAESTQDSGGHKDSEKKRKTKPRGRRELKTSSLEEERIELPDPLLEELVAQGRAERIGFEESSKLAYKRGGMRRLVIARVKYRATRNNGRADIETTPMPQELFPRLLASASMLAHIIIDKHCDGLPLFRIEDRFTRDGFGVDRGTLSRWLEDAGATLGATVVAAAREEAMRTAFCIATDATGVAVQPTALPEKKRQPCRRGHYFVLIADRDHVFYEYVAKENSRTVADMFYGYSGYIQADAKSVYDALFKPPDERPADSDDAVRQEVACWAHCRRKYWEATLAKCPIGREGLVRIGRIFEVDAGFHGKAPSQIATLRQAHLRPHMLAFFAWAAAEYEAVRDQRGLLRSALGYALRQRDALMRVLDDGRLVLDNNRSELALRRIAVGRKAWLFMGSDDHAESAGHLFSLIASARLHGVDPESYLRDVIRILAYWPRDRYIELAPKYWAVTRSRLCPNELAREVGHLTVPARLDAHQEAMAN